MIRQKSLASAVILGLFFESLTAGRFFGFYLLPALAMALFYGFMPFTIKLLNMILVWVLGAAIIFLFAALLNGWERISPKFILHVLIYISLLSIVFHISSYAEKK